MGTTRWSRVRIPVQVKPRKRGLDMTFVVSRTINPKIHSFFYDGKSAVMLNCKMKHKDQSRRQRVVNNMLSSLCNFCSFLLTKILHLSEALQLHISSVRHQRVFLAITQQLFFDFDILQKAVYAYHPEVEQNSRSSAERSRSNL